MDCQSPYQPPQSLTALQPGGPPRRTPPVWRWYLAYCILMALLYGGLTIFAVAFMLLADQIPDVHGNEAIMMRIQFAVILVFALPLTIVFGVPPLLPKRRAAWIYGLVLICIGMTSACCLPATIPLLIFWIKPETKEFFGGGQWSVRTLHAQERPHASRFAG